MSLLELKGLKISYGGINAVKGIDLTVQEGEMVALIGANGAGKTTTLKAICGLLTPAAGRVHYRGEDVTRAPSYALVERGLVIPAQLWSLFREVEAQLFRYPQLNPATLRQALTVALGREPVN